MVKKELKAANLREKKEIRVRVVVDFFFLYIKKVGSVSKKLISQERGVCFDFPVRK
jgi:hypothetical protein